MSELLRHFEGLRAEPDHHPWPRFRVDAGRWLGLRDALVHGRFDLLAEFAEPGEVHAVLFDPESLVLAVASLPCPEARFPALGAVHLPAVRFERTIRELAGLEPEGLADTRNWLDHGKWPLSRPLAATPSEPRAGFDHPFLPVEGEGLHQIPVGPIHAGIIEPGHFRFTANGETVVRLEERLGWVHKGIERRLAGLDIDLACRIVGRVSGDSTVAFAWAFARAAEAVCGTAPPPRAVSLRALMLELERLANHFGDIGAICNDAAFGLIHAHCGVLREKVLRACGEAFGHRLMMDRVVPGGVAVDPDAAGIARLRALLEELAPAFEAVVSAYDNTPSLLDRTVDTGRVEPELARRFAAGGHVGRASGRAFDSRAHLATDPFDALDFRPVLREAGDVNARVWVRIEEVRESLRLATAILGRLPDGPVRIPLAPRAGCGLGIAEAFRGEVLVWLRLGEDGRVRRCHPRDASWLQWPLPEAAIEGNTSPTSRSATRASTAPIPVTTSEEPRECAGSGAARCSRHRSRKRPPRPTRRPSPNSPGASTPVPAPASAARSRSARWTPVPATAASSRSTR
jgi:Ni,Fe-hydrogenase III large subunit